MASYKKFALTEKGQLLLNKVIAGECDLVVTKAATGDGEPEEGEDLKIWTALKNQRQFFGISSFSRLDDKIRIRFVISNYDPGSGAGLEEEYRVKEIGVYAEDPEEGEILYAVSTADAGKGDFIPAYDETSPMTVTVNAYLVVGTGGNVLIRVSPDAYATAADVAELRQRTGDVEDTIDGLKTVAFTGSYNDLNNKPTPETIGLGNVDNTSDASKPVSTAQQTAIDAAYENANEFTLQKIAELINGAPETLDTLKEVAEAITEHKSVTDALDAAIGRKANQADLSTVAFTGNYSDLTNKPTVVNLGAVNRSGDTMTGQLSLKPKTGEGGQICLSASEAHPKESGIQLDQCDGLFRIFGEPSVDGSVTGVGTPLVIDVYGKTIKGGYTFYGNPRISSLLVPNETDTVDVGSSELRFHNVHANNMRLKGSGNHGSKLNFGDADFVYLYEDTDDHLLIHANKGVKIDSNMSVSGSITGGTWEHSASTGYGVYWSSAATLRSVSEKNRPSLGTNSVPFNFIYASAFYEDGKKLEDKYAVVKTGTNSDIGLGGWRWYTVYFGITYKDIPFVNVMKTSQDIDSSISIYQFIGNSSSGYTGFQYGVYTPNKSWTYSYRWFAVGNIK